MTKYSINVSDTEIFFPREISRVLDFDNTLVVQTKPKPEETNEDWFKIDSIFGISKLEGKIIWARPGFEISKQKKEPKIFILGSKNIQPVKHELLIYAISLMFYINPDTGEVLRTEQSK